MPGRVRQILDGRGRQAAAPEERVDLAVLQRIRGLGGAEPLAPDVAIGIEPAAVRMRNAITSVPLPGEPVETPFAAQIGDRRDAATRRASRCACSWSRAPRGSRPAPARPSNAPRPVDRVGQRVGERERDVGLAVANQLEVVDRGRGDFRRRPDAGQALVQDLREAAAVRIVHAAGAARRDREEPRARPRRCRRRRRRQTEQRQRPNGRTLRFTR